MDNLSTIINILEHSSYNDIIMDLEVNGFNVPQEIDTNDKMEPYSTDIIWDSILNISKDRKNYKISLRGSAIAEMSYEKWIETYGYEIKEFDIKINNLK